jgi:hypothetical protein
VNENDPACDHMSRRIACTVEVPKVVHPDAKPLLLIHGFACADDRGALE